MTLYSHANFSFFHHLVLITQHALTIIKGFIGNATFYQTCMQNKISEKLRVQ